VLFQSNQQYDNVVNDLTILRQQCSKEGVLLTHPVYPVLAVDVGEASVERVGREHKDEVARVAHAAQQIVVELAGAQFLDVEEHRQTAQLQVNFQQAAPHRTTHIHTQSRRSHSVTKQWRTAGSVLLHDGLGLASAHDETNTMQQER